MLGFRSLWIRHLPGMLLKAAEGVGSWRCIEIPDFDAAVPAGRDQNVLVVLAPDAVVQPIGGVEDRDLPQAPRGHL